MSNEKQNEPARAPSKDPAAQLEPDRPWWAVEVERDYRTYRDPLHRFVRNLARDRRLPKSALDIEDVVQETFQQLMKHWPSVNNSRAWMYTVARHLVDDAQKDFRRSVPAADPSLSEGASTFQWTSCAPRASDEAIVLAQEVLRNIAHLPHQQAVAVYLRNVQGWSPNEVADYLDCKPTTARGHDHRGRSWLGKQLSVLRTGNLSTAPRSSDGLAAAALAALVWAALAVLLCWLKVPTPLAVLGPGVPVVAVVGRWVARAVALRGSAGRLRGEPDHPG